MSGLYKSRPAPRRRREHTLLAYTLGIRRLVVCVNKMDVEASGQMATSQSTPTNRSMPVKLKIEINMWCDQHVFHVTLKLCQGIVEEYGLIQLGKLRSAIARP